MSSLPQSAVVMHIDCTPDEQIQHRPDSDALVLTGAIVGHASFPRAVKEFKKIKSRNSAVRTNDLKVRIAGVLADAIEELPQLRPLAISFIAKVGEWRRVGQEVLDAMPSATLDDNYWIIGEDRLHRTHAEVLGGYVAALGILVVRARSRVPGQGPLLLALDRMPGKQHLVEPFLIAVRHSKTFSEIWADIDQRLKVVPAWHANKANPGALLADWMGQAVTANEYPEVWLQRGTDRTESDRAGVAELATRMNKCGSLQIIEVLRGLTGRPPAQS